MDKTAKILLIASGTFAIAVCANLVSNAIYTNSKIGVDKKTALMASAVGLTATFLLIKHFKTH